MSGNKRYQIGIKLRSLVGYDKVEYLPEEAKKLIIDWHILDEIISSTNEDFLFFDYSFALAPLYKAIESILFKIATDLGLVEDEGMLGSFFNEDKIEKVFPKITVKISDNNLKKLVKNQLHELKTFLMRYRHFPAHFGSRFENLEQERIAAHAALHNIKCILDDLGKAGLLKLDKDELEEKDLELDLTDISF